MNLFERDMQAALPMLILLLAVLVVAVVADLIGSPIEQWCAEYARNRKRKKSCPRKVKSVRIVR